MACLLLNVIGCLRFLWDRLELAERLGADITEDDAGAEVDRLGGMVFK